MLGQRLQIQKRGAGQKIHSVQTGDRGYRRARSGGQYKAICGNHTIAYAKPLVVFEARFAADEFPVVLVDQLLVLVASKRADELVLFIHEPGEVHRLGLCADSLERLMIRAPEELACP